MKYTKDIDLDHLALVVATKVLDELVFWIKSEDIDALKNKIQKDGDIKYLSSKSLLEVVKRNKDNSKLAVIKDWIIRTDDKEFDEKSLRLFFERIIKLIDK